ncbi:MAG: MFS transporter [Actinomycetia bacterium]|nr:MFS transporter [Actinomycetes bacterium]
MTAVGASGGAAPSSIFAGRYRAASAGIIILTTLLAFESMAVAPALPTVARDLRAVGAIGWAFTGFLVSNIVGMVVAGQVSDARGPRLPAAMGLGGFAAGLAISGTSTTMVQFVAGRCVQGLGGGLLMTSIYVMIGSAYPGFLRPKIFAAMASAWVLPSLIGPLVSGTLTQHVSWRLVFLGLLPFALIGAALLVPVLRRSFASSSAEPGAGLGDRRRIVRALAAAAGVAGIEAAGQHPSPGSVAAAVVGIALLAWGLRALLPAGTFRARHGVPAAVALRGLLAGSMFGVEAMVPLALSVQHGYGATASGLPLVSSAVTWAIASWLQGRDRVRLAARGALIRAGFVLLVLGAVGAAVIARPGVPGWWMYLAWAVAGFGGGLAMPSMGVLLLHYTTDADRGADSAALQLGDAVTCALTTGFGGILVAAAERAVIGYTTAFVTLDLAMAALAVVGVVVARQARVPRTDTSG